MINGHSSVMAPSLPLITFTQIWQVDFNRLGRQTGLIQSWSRIRGLNSGVRFSGRDENPGCTNSLLTGRHLEVRAWFLDGKSDCADE